MMREEDRLGASGEAAQDLEPCRCGLVIEIHEQIVDDERQGMGGR